MPAVIMICSINKNINDNTEPAAKKNTEKLG